MTDARRWLGKLLGLAEDSLRVFGDGCLWCGSSLRNGSDPRSPALCAACGACVPWIDRPACLSCGRAERCPDCPRRTHSYIAASRSAVQYTPFMKELLARYKYRGSEKLAPLFGEMACVAYGQLQSIWRAENDGGTEDGRAARFRRRLRGDGGAASGGRVVLTFVPLSERRLEERGFNQAETMARAVGRKYRLPVVPLLVRTRHTEKQSYKSRRERLESLDRAFAPHPGGIAELRRLRAAGPVRLVIVDDVYTTGSTLQRCGEALTGAIGPGSAAMYGLTWAR